MLEIESVRDQLQCTPAASTENKGIVIRRLILTKSSLQYYGGLHQLARRAITAENKGTVTSGTRKI